MGTLTPHPPRLSSHLWRAGAPGYNPPDAFKVTIPVQNNYMYARMKKSLPELYAFTICLWLKSKALSGLGTPFSYSVPTQANEIVLLEWGSNPLEVLKARLDGALGGLTWWLAALPEAGVGNEWSSMAIPTQSPSVIL